MWICLAHLCSFFPDLTARKSFLPPAPWCWDVSAESALRTHGPVPGDVVWRSAFGRGSLGAFKNTRPPEHTLTEDVDYTVLLLKEKESDSGRGNWAGWGLVHEVSENKTPCRVGLRMTPFLCNQMAKSLYACMWVYLHSQLRKTVGERNPRSVPLVI